MRHAIQIDSAGGEYMDSVLVLEWAVAPGGAVSAGQTIVTVETAKAATEIAAPADGFLAGIAFAAGQEAPVGAVLGYVSDSAEPAAEPAAAPPAAQAEPALAPVAATAAEPAGRRPGRIIASPLARRIAAAQQIDLATVAGSGPHGRIKRADVEAAARRRTSTTAAPTTATPAVLPADAAVPVVMIHGFGADRSGWNPVLGLMGTDRRVLLPELPGHGDAPAPDAAPRDIEDLALAMADRLRAEGVAQAHLVGHSLGGAVAIALADMGLVAVRSLCLIAPGGLGPEAHTGFIHGLAQATRPEELQPWLDQMVADPAILPAGLARAMLRRRAAADQGPGLVALARALFGTGTQTMRLAPRLARLTMPVKVIWGQQDRILPPVQADGLPGHIALHRLAATGHVPQLEQPALVARLIAELIRAAA